MPSDSSNFRGMFVFKANLMEIIIKILLETRESYIVRQLEREENKNRFSKLASFFKSRKSVNYIGKIGQSVFVIHTQDLI